MSLKIDTSYNLDTRTIIGEELPTVYIDRIIVDDYVKDPSADQSLITTNINIVVKDSTIYTKNLNLERSDSNELLIPYSSIIAIGDFVIVSEEDLI